MQELSQPTDIARETLRQLTLARIPPTPENYASLYSKVAGTADEGFPEIALRRLVSALPRTTSTQERWTTRLEQAVKERSWNALHRSLADLMQDQRIGERLWVAVFRELIRQLEQPEQEQALQERCQTLEQLIDIFGNTPEQLAERLQVQLRHWRQASLGLGNNDPESVADGAHSQNEPAPPELSSEWREIIAQLLESVQPALSIESPELVERVNSLANRVREANDLSSIESAGREVKHFIGQLNWVASDQLELKHALLKLFELLVENVSNLVMDDVWLNGQIAMFRDFFKEPLSLRQLDDIERRLKDVITKQTALKSNLDDAKARLRTLLNGFVDHLASFSASTNDYHDKISTSADRIAAAQDISELTEVIENVMRETRLVQAVSARSREELTAMRHRVNEAEIEIGRLQQELAQTSELVRQDQLTGALNRKGMEEAFIREVSRARRKHSPLSIGLLDIDNFKRLNDTYGHCTGDEALVHLSTIVRETLRPQDTLARYGGEEFVIMLPDTTAENGLTALARVQRELTRRIFMGNDERILITFSAGIAEVQQDETLPQVVGRADAAMYAAKHAGKNRVFMA